MTLLGGSCVVMLVALAGPRDCRCVPLSSSVPLTSPTSWHWRSVQHRRLQALLVRGWTEHLHGQRNVASCRCRNACDARTPFPAATLPQEKHQLPVLHAASVGMRTRTFGGTWSGNWGRSNLVRAWHAVVHWHHGSPRQPVLPSVSRRLT